MEIFSKDFKKVFKKFNESSFKTQKSNGYFEIDIKNKIKKENEKTNIQISHERFNSCLDFKKFFELNFKKNIFTIDETNQNIKAKIFTKFLKVILRSKKLTQIYKLLNLDSYNDLYETDELSPKKIEKRANGLVDEFLTNRFNRLLNYNMLYLSSTQNLESPYILVHNNINEIFKDLEKFEFNIFDFSKLNGRENIMSLITLYILEKSNFSKFLSMDKYENFISKTRKKYKDNPYHNEIHAVDVLHTCYLFSQKTNLQEACQLDHIDLLAYLFASLLHDIGHPGLNNSYQQNKQTKLALRYNDKSVLENYHSYKGSRIFSKNSTNILEKLSSIEIKNFRKRFIGCIFATDMMFHNNVLSKVSSKVDKINAELKLENEIKETIRFSKNENEIDTKDINEFTSKNLFLISDKRIKKFLELETDPQNINNYSCQSNQTKVFDLQQDFLNFLVHSSDVSNPSKDLSVYSIWTKLVIQEFFNQGDLEKAENLPVSYLCDRTTTDVGKTQVGFINFIVMPLFQTMSFYLPSINIYEENVKKNLDYFKNVKQFDIEYEI